MHIRSILTFFAVQLYACGPMTNSTLFEDTAEPKAMRLGVNDAGVDSLTAIIAIDQEPNSVSMVQYCSGTVIECGMTSPSWKQATPIQLRPGFFSIPESLLATKQLNLKLIRDSNEIAKRTVTFAKKDAISEPDSTQPLPDPQTPNPEQTLCYKADKFTCDVELAIHKYTNEYRKRNNRSETTFHPKIGFVSRDWSQKQAQRGSIGHEGFLSSRIAVYKAEFSQYDASMSSENVAMSGGVNMNSADAVGKYFADMWYNSPGHQRNMLSTGARVHGPGVFVRGRSIYATQIFGSR